jgi:glucose/mannose-6-phosphate isomerase
VDANIGSLASLDDPRAFERLDPQGMLARIEALPEQCEEGWRRASAFEWPGGLADARAVVVLGMGGSAIAGDLLRALALPLSRAPVSVVRSYDVPAFVGPETLVVACSHSGDTEETLSAFDQALARGARAVVVAKGGRLRALADEHGVPAFTYEFAGEPRSALGHQFMALLALGERAGLVGPQAAAVGEAVARMRGQRAELGRDVPAGRNAAKQLAGRLHGRLPVVIGAGVLSEAAHRWKTQLNENSKVWALWEELPELDHNTIVGFGLPREIVDRLHVVFLSHPALHPRVHLRYEATADALADAGVAHERVEALGESPLAQALTAVYFGDLATYYLGLLNGADPSDVGPLEKLKARLARSE